MCQHLNLLVTGKTYGGNARARTGLGKTDRPGSQGGLRKRRVEDGALTPGRLTDWFTQPTPQLLRAAALSRLVVVVIVIVIVIVVVIVIMVETSQLERSPTN